MSRVSHISSWLRILTNRPEIVLNLAAPHFAFDRVDGAGVARPEPLQSWPQRPRAARCDLLIVITTYGRAEACLRLIHTIEHACQTLRSARPGQQIEWLVLEDPSPEDYTQSCIAAHATAASLTWLRARQHHGKQGYWSIYQAAYLFAEALAPERTLFIQDDLELEADMLARALDLDERLAGAKPRVLNLFSSEDDEPDGRWIKYARRPVSGSPARQTQWFDLAAYLIHRSALEALQYRLVPVPASRWRRNRSRSSGVGEQLTRRLFRRADIYQCFPPLVFHGAHESVMNAEARTSRAMDNRAFKTK